MNIKMNNSRFVNTSMIQNQKVLFRQLIAKVNEMENREGELVVEELVELYLDVNDEAPTTKHMQRFPEETKKKIEEEFILAIKRQAERAEQRYKELIASPKIKQNSKSANNRQFVDTSTTRIN